MIPVKLQMFNFLSYGEEVAPLDFTQFSIACLSGKNGQGKSALLDAITWAIWGEGRKASQDRKADSGLLKIGENQMWVDLTIDLEGERFRIIRKFSKLKNKNHSELELQVFEEKKSAFISLTSPSIRQTQQRINRLLRMDYDTFINSAFILQGRVDEFTRKSARERKQILSEVLGLSHYEALSVLSRQYLREIEGKLLTLKNRLEQINQEIAQKNALEEEIRSIQENERNNNSKIKQIRENLKKLEKKKNKLHYEQEREKELVRRIHSDEKELQIYLRRKKTIEQGKKDYQLVLSREKQILADYDKYQNLYTENQRMISLMQQYRELDKTKRELEAQIEKGKNNLLFQLEQKKKQYRELQEKVNSVSSKQKEIQELTSKIEQFDVLIKRQEHIQQEGNQLNVKIESKNNQVKRLRDEIKKNQEKIDLLSLRKQGNCPLCQSPLDEQKIKIIRRNTEKEVTQKNHEIKNLMEEVINLSTKKNLLQQEWKQNRNEIRQKEEIQNKLTTFSFLIKEGQKAQEQSHQLMQEIKNHEEQISQKLFARNERNRLTEIEKEIQKQEYDDKRYIRINRELENIKEAPLQKEKLSEAKITVINLEKDYAEIDNQLEHKKDKIIQLKKEYQEMIKNIEELPELEKALLTQQESLNQLQQYCNDLFQKKGACQEKLTKIEEYQKEEQNIVKQKESQLHKKEIYQKLTTAFGKNGIQSMIIENAIPELEEEANIILSQLSSERTTITLESLKELRSGDLRETLDIKIHDDMGVRPYELYSGGETFRIDFAIRIALSKLLTYRTGARLRTLVIDEGFGTQDEDGLQKLIQAIHAIQDDFDKILVITHLSLLKDAFPVRIEVWKDPTLGSQFELIHL